MKITRKQIAFDLDTKALEKYYPTQHWRNAYEDIKQHMKNYGFYWQQGSVYISKMQMKDSFAKATVTDLATANPWLNICMRDCTVANIEREYDLNSLFDKTAPVPARVAVGV